MNILKTIAIDDKIVNIYCDEDPQNPRTSWDNDDVLVLSHRRYNLAFECPKYCYDSLEELEKIIKSKNDIAEILPVYMYDHSGISLSSSPFECKWDSGKIGFIFITKENARKSHNVKRISKRVRGIIHKNLLANIEVYSQYLNGEYYGYSVLDKDDNELDSCWGFYGWDNVVEQATEAGKNCEVPKIVEPEDPRQMKLALEVA